MADLQENVIEFQSILIPKTFSNEIIQQFYQVHQLPNQQIKGLQIYCEMIKSENTFEMYEGLVGLRTILTDQSPNFELDTNSLAVCELNTLKYIIHIIEHNKLQLILFEALWILTNLTGGSSQIVDQIKEDNSINCLIQKFSSGNYHDLLIKFICFIFANVTADSIKNRYLMIKLGALEILNNYAIEKIRNFGNVDLISLLAWSINIFFEPTSIPPLKDLQVSLKFFSKWIYQDFPVQILQDICWSFARFVRYHPLQIQLIIDLGIVPRIIELAEVDKQQILYPNIILLTYILESHQNHQEYLYELGIIPCLGRLIKKHSQSSVKLKYILKAFTVISLSKYLSQQLLNSIELDLLLSLFILNNITISDQIHFIIENLIMLGSDIDSITISFEQSKNLIMLCKIFAARDQIKQKKELCERILNLCDVYLKEKRYSLYHEDLEELEKLKKKITYKLQ